MGQNATNSELSPQKQQLLEALLLGASVTDAAEQVGISRRTAGRWLDEAGFQEALRQAQSEALERALRALSNTGVAAVATLRRNMLSDAPPATQVRAAIAVLEQTVKLKEYQELAERVADLEARVALSQEGGMR